MRCYTLSPLIRAGSLLAIVACSGTDGAEPDSGVTLTSDGAVFDAAGGLDGAFADAAINPRDGGAVSDATIEPDTGVRSDGDMANDGDDGRSPCVSPGASGECPVEGFIDRPYTVYVPAHDDSAPLPVVMAFHGGGGNASAGAASTCPDGDLADPECLHNVGARRGFVTVYPNGTPGPRGPEQRIWNAGGGQNGWACVGFCRDDIDEAGYVVAVLDDLASWLPIDGDRIFGAGLSNGGAVLHRLACELADRFAAVAAIGAGNQFATSANCTPSRPIAVLHVHGTADGCWPYEGGPIVCANPNNTAPVVSVEQSMTDWAARNGCVQGATTVDGPNRVDDDVRVEEDRWSGCAAPVRHYRAIGGGHTWLGGRQFLPVNVIGPPYPDLSNEDLWSFFQVANP